MNDKLLTVVIPMYNVEAYIRQCLDSFLVPEILERLEILMIDDGSPDNSAEIAMNYMQNYPQTYCLVQKENGGHGSAVNKGIELARGKYFKVVDGDDWVDKEALLHLVSHLECCDSDMVLSNYYWVDHKTGKRTVEAEEICPGIAYGKEYPLEEVAARIFMKMHAITFKTEVIRSQPERLDEHCFYVDTEYMLFPLPYVKTVSAVPDFVYQYRIGLPGQSMSAEKLRSQCSQHERVLKRLLRFYRQNRESSCAELLEKTLARVATSQCKIYLMAKESQRGKFLRLENTLKKNYPKIYQAVTNPGILLLRRTRYRLYGLVSLVVRKKVR